jgi:hypothetical protein
MLTWIRRQFTFANVTVTVALVFAMAGGAFAASHKSHAAKKSPVVITSLKQINPKVVAALKGQNGKDGAQGVAGQQGPQGVQGSEGAKGKDGVPGEPGSRGATGPSGATGPVGATGPKGSTGSTGPEGICATASCTLPKGASLKGEWAMRENQATGINGLTSAISLGVPLASAPTAHYIPEGTPEGSDPTGCKGTVSAPVAVSGNLCVFAEEEQNIFQTAPFNPAVTGVTTFGFIIKMASSEEGLAAAAGSWAVTG